MKRDPQNIIVILILSLTFSAGLFPQKLSTGSERKIAALINRLSDVDPFIAGEAVDSLVQIGVPALEYLTNALSDKDDNVRLGASIALYKFAPGDQRIITSLVKALQDKNDEVRWVAANALGKFKKAAAEAAPLLRALLRDDDREVRWAAYCALLKINRELIFTKPNVTEAIDIIDTLVPRLMRELKVPGVSISIINNYELKWAGAYGITDSVSKAKVTDRTIFEACSMSKPLFAYLVLKLAEDGKIDLDRPLTHYLPEPFISEDDEYPNLITARMILTHTGGMPNWRKGGEERGAPLPVYFKPGSKFNYSGEGFYYLQRVIEKITGEVLQQFSKRVLLDKLGLSSTGYVWSACFDSLTAEGHDELGKTINRSKYMHANSAYTLYTTPVEYSKFIIDIMKTNKSSQSFLSRNMIDEMLKHQLRSDAREVIDRPGRALGLFSYRGLGWGIDSTISGNIVYHSGANQTGFRCYSQFNIAEGSGIVIMTNGLNGGELWKRVISLTGDL